MQFKFVKQLFNNIDICFISFYWPYDHDYRQITLIVTSLKTEEQHPHRNVNYT